MREQQLEREKEATLRAIADKQKEAVSVPQSQPQLAPPPSAAGDKSKRSRWDGGAPTSRSDWEGSEASAPAKRSRWDATPADVSAAGGRSRWDATPSARAGGETPGWGALDGATPAKRTRSRWDETPLNVAPGATPAGGFGGATPAGYGGATPAGGAGGFEPLVPGVPLTPEQYNALRWEREVEERNRPLSDVELDAMLPCDGYKVVEPPSSYVPIRTPSRKLMATPAPGATPLYGIPEEDRGQTFDLPPAPEGLPIMKPEDYQYFAPLLKETADEELSVEEQKERKIMRLLLKIKNGAPPQRKSSLRQITDKAREFGAGPLFNQILPLLMSPTLEDQERHLLVKVIDRILYKLDELVRPFVHKILVVIEPLLIDEDYYARVEGREIISNLSKAAGLATMIAAMRPDIDNVDEYVRNTTARAFSVVASALGIPALLPFLKAVCQSKKSWQARHTGIKIVQQIAILSGCAVLPHLTALVDIIAHGLGDENQKVRTICALAIAALAEAAAPYGIESFDSVLKPLWHGIRAHRGKVRAAPHA